MAPLYTAQAVDAPEATEQEILDALQEAVKAKTDTWLAANAPKLKIAVDAGDITISAVANDDSPVERVDIAFALAGTTGDRKRLMKLAAVLLQCNEFHPTDLGSDTYRVQTPEAQRWAKRVEEAL